MNFFYKNKKGFTLVELLVVIAVIGVLIAIVVMAVDPIEQLARGRDAGRKAAVAQLGRAMSAYATNQARTSYPGAADGITTGTTGTWQSFLDTAGELSNPIRVVASPVGLCVPPASGSREWNVCYNPSGSDAVIWTILESRSERDRSDGTTSGGPCTSTAGVGFVVWSSVQGRAGLWCPTGPGAGAGSVPTPGVTLF